MRVSARFERRHHIDRDLRRQSSCDELRGLHGAHERAGPDMRGRAVMPAQSIAERDGLLASMRSQVTYWIAQLERLVDRFGMSDQEHVHVSSVPSVA